MIDTNAVEDQIIKVWSSSKLSTKSLPQTMILDSTKLKAFADNRIHVNVILTKILVLDRVGRNRKRRLCWLPAFSPFPTMFLKGFALQVIKTW